MLLYGILAEWVVGSDGWWVAVLVSTEVAVAVAIGRGEVAGFDTSLRGAGGGQAWWWCVGCNRVYCWARVEDGDAGVLAWASSRAIGSAPKVQALLCYTHAHPADSTLSLSYSAYPHNVLLLCMIICATTVHCVQPLPPTANSVHHQREPQATAPGTRFNAVSKQWHASTQSTSAEATARKRSSPRANSENPTSPPTPSWTRGPTRMASATSTAKSRQMRSSTWTGDAS